MRRNHGYVVTSAVCRLPETRILISLLLRFLLHVSSIANFNYQDIPSCLVWFNFVVLEPIAMFRWLTQRFWRIPAEPERELSDVNGNSGKLLYREDIYFFLFFFFFFFFFFFTNILLLFKCVSQPIVLLLTQ